MLSKLFVLNYLEITYPINLKDFNNIIEKIVVKIRKPCKVNETGVSFTGGSTPFLWHDHVRCTKIVVYYKRDHQITKKVTNFITYIVQKSDAFLCIS
jgi:hypothetical protein